MQNDEPIPKGPEGAGQAYTQVPNVLFDAAMREMGGAELKVVLAVIRKTLGWHRQRDAVSLSQLEDMTGLTRSNVVRGAREAVRKGWIRCEKAGRSSWYELTLRDKVDLDDPALQGAAQDREGPAAPAQRRVRLRDGDCPTALQRTDSPEPRSAETGLPTVPKQDHAGPETGLPIASKQDHAGPETGPQIVPKQDPQKKGKKEPHHAQENSLARAARGGVEDRVAAASARQADALAPSAAESDAITRLRQTRRALDDHEASRHRELFDGLTAICVVDPKLMGGRIARTARQLREADPTAVRTTMDEFLAWWKTSDFRGQRGKPPTLDQVLASWKLFRGNYAERPAARPADAAEKTQKGTQYMNRLSRLYTEVTDG